MPVLASLFNSEYFEILKTTYFEEHLQTAASEIVFMKIKFFNIKTETRKKMYASFFDFIS